MEPGTVVICQSNKWYSAHGREYTVNLGERLTISKVYRVGGAMFLKFKEIEVLNDIENPGFLSTGFSSIKNYN